MWKELVVFSSVAILIFGASAFLYWLIFGD